MRLLYKNVFSQNQEFHFQYHKGLSDFIGEHSHDFCEMFIVTKGQVLHYIDDVQEVLQQGDVVFIQNGRHKYEKTEAYEVEYINIAFSRDTFKKYADLMFGEHIDVSDFNAKNWLTPQTTALIRRKGLWVMRASRPEAEIKVLFLDLLIKLECKKLSVKSGNALVNEILAKLKNTGHFAMNLSEIIGQTNYSYEHAARVFKNETGQTLTDFFNEQKITYAKNLLAFSDTSVIEISNLCGFSNLSYFYKLFKEYTGSTPGTFKKMNGNIIL